METKVFEIRDRGTFIPALATRIRPSRCNMGADGAEDQHLVSQNYLIRRGGWGYDSNNLVLVHLQTKDSEVDPFDWKPRGGTMSQAHEYIEDHWDELSTGDVICLEFIRGERDAPKVSERTGGYDAEG